MDAETVREHLAVVVKSPQFARSRRLQRFLEFVVERELTGQRKEIQEYTIGLEVFDRRESFDPRSDSIVRVEARRLRERLASFYEGEGRRETVRIVLPQRGYVPSFERRYERPAWTARVAAASAAAVAVAVVVYGVRTFPRAPSGDAPPVSAIEAFEKGMTAYGQWTGDGARQAEMFFSAAIAHDPGYARAHAWLSAAYRQQALMGDTSVGEIYEKSLEAARMAVDLDPGLAEAHDMLAVNLTFEPRWQAAEESFRTAIRIEPNSADAHHIYGIALLAASSARLSDAEAELRTAVRLAPGDLANSVVLAKVLYFRGRFQEAREILEETLAIDPYYPDAMRNLAAVLVQTEDYAEAIRWYEEAQRLAHVPWGDGLLAHALAVSGDEPRAQALLADLEARYASKAVAALSIATAQVGLEQWDRACTSLRQAWAHREFRTRYIDVDPIYTPLRDRHCFRALVDDMGLADLSPNH